VHHAYFFFRVTVAVFAATHTQRYQTTKQQGILAMRMRKVTESEFSVNSIDSTWLTPICGLQVIDIHLSSSRQRSTLYELYRSNPQAYGANVAGWNTPDSRPPYSKTWTTRITTVRLVVAAFMAPAWTSLNFALG
jgi:hypothetical protein